MADSIMKKRIINAPTPETLAMLKRRMPSESRNRLESIRIDAIGLIMLPVPICTFTPIWQVKAHMLRYRRSLAAVRSISRRWRCSARSPQ
jgi:hypothetical protein